VSPNALSLPTSEAAEVIRQRRDKEAKKLARRRRAEVAKGVEVPTKTEAWQRAFEAVIIYYEKHDDVDMADLLRLDLDRFVRRDELQGQALWDKKKEKKAG
jgi:hypothetical protein